MTVFANDLPYTDGNLDPVEALQDALAFSADDWSESRAMAWVYGIVLGWNEAMNELADRYHWTPEQVDRLRELHRRFELLV